MKNIVYSVKKYCNYCKEDITINLYSDEPDYVFKHPSQKREVDDWGLHYHWIDFHRICAKCGEIVSGGDLEVIAQDEIRWKIHEAYVKHAKGRKIELLSVHKKCAE